MRSMTKSISAVQPELYVEAEQAETTRYLHADYFLYRTMCEIVVFQVKSLGEMLKRSTVTEDRADKETPRRLRGGKNDSRKKAKLD